jgi:hypothetical protein
LKECIEHTDSEPSPYHVGCFCHDAQRYDIGRTLLRKRLRCSEIMGIRAI